MSTVLNGELVQDSLIRGNSTDCGGNMLRIPKTLCSIAAVAALWVGVLGSSAAAFVIDNSGANPVCDQSTVTLTGEGEADVCAGWFGLTNNSPTTQQNKLNEVDLSNDDWEFVYRADESTAAGEFGGILFELKNVDVGDVSGSWTIQWSDEDINIVPNLPQTIDIAAGFKGGSSQSDAGIAYFLFEAVLLTNDPFSRNGTFDLTGIGQGQGVGLSHESLFVRNLKAPPPPGPDPDPVPAPAPLLLISLGGLLVGWMRHRAVR